MPHGAACTRYPVRTKFKFCSWNSHDHQYLQTSFSRDRDGTGKKKRRGRHAQKRVIKHVLKWKTPRSFWLHIHQSAWCVGRNFCGYLILRFFLNRKNSQNIVPANNSNNKVPNFVLLKKVRNLIPDENLFLSWGHRNSMLSCFVALESTKISSHARTSFKSKVRKWVPDENL